jgi:predicted nuclease of predicted toxin-antitoxin system
MTRGAPLGVVMEVWAIAGMGERVIITGDATAVNQVKGAFAGSGPRGVVLEVWAIAGMGERVIITGDATAVNQVKGAFADGEPHN